MFLKCSIGALSEKAFGDGCLRVAGSDGWLTVERLGKQCHRGHKWFVFVRRDVCFDARFNYFVLGRVKQSEDSLLERTC